MVTAETQVLGRPAASEQAIAALPDEVEAYLRAHTASQPEEIAPYAVASRPADMYPSVEEKVRREVLGLTAAAVALRHNVAQETGNDAADDGTSEVKSSVTMLDMLRAAGAGDEQSRAAATENISTMVREVTKKYQSVSKVTGHIDGSGRFWQYGQNSRDYLMNTFAYMAVNKTTKDEAHGMLRFEEQVRRGLLSPGDTYWEISCVPEGERQQLSEAGYFLESMSYVIRGLMLQEDGSVEIESAFVAGVDQEQLAVEKGAGMSEQEATGRHERALEIRHDKAVLERLQQSGRLQFNLNGDSSIQSFITAKGAAPNGAVDIVRLCDDVTEEIIGKEVFFGVVQSREDYAAFPAKCREHMRTFDGLVQDVLGEAQARVGRGEVTDPADIPAMLREIVADYLTPRAVGRRDFDIRVLGFAAADLLISARQAADAGNTDAANDLTKEARKKAAVDDCPGARRRQEADDDDDTATAESESSSEDCIISTFCPHCSDLNYNGSPTSIRVPVVARIDPHQTIHCGRCHGFAGPTGNFEGFIKPKAAQWSRRRRSSIHSQPRVAVKHDN